MGRAYSSLACAVPGPVAQLVEQGTFNPKVAGSKPARPIKKPEQMEDFPLSRFDSSKQPCVRNDVHPDGCHRLPEGAITPSLHARHSRRWVLQRSWTTFEAACGCRTPGSAW